VARKWSDLSGLCAIVTMVIMLETCTRSGELQGGGALLNLDGTALPASCAHVNGLEEGLWLGLPRVPGVPGVHWCICQGTK
jgi:hypothetical protein